MQKYIYCLKISINGTSPKVWRRFTIESDIVLPELHKIIQIIMGWENSKSHQFIDNKNIYAPDNEYEKELDKRYSETKLGNILKKEDELILYKYNFKDNWFHNIILEKILYYDKNYKYPICTGGEMKCPPENCEGPWGFSEMLEKYHSSDLSKRKEIYERFGKDYNPELFDKDNVNDKLRKQYF